GDPRAVTPARAVARPVCYPSHAQPAPALSGCALACRWCCSERARPRSAMPTGILNTVTATAGAVMAWYQIITATSDSSGADRDAEALLRLFSAVVQAVDVPVDAEGDDGRTAQGARRSYFSLSPEAGARAERVLASSEATALTAPLELTGIEKIRRL